MVRRRLASAILRVAGLLLMLLGVVHLIATPHVPALLDGLPQRARAFALGPTLLNHVLVGVLLLPLGFTTWVAASDRHLHEPWAKGVLTANSLVLLALPALVLLFMRQPLYYHAPLFLAGVGLAATCAFLVAGATWVGTSAAVRASS